MIRGSLVSATRHFADNFSVGRPANRRPLLLVRVVANCFQRESTHEPLAHVTVGDRSPEPGRWCADAGRPTRFKPSRALSKQIGLSLDVRPHNLR